MAINPENIDVTTIPNLPTGAFGLNNYLPQSDPNGVMTKNTQANFAAFIAPYVAAISSSAYVNVTSNALPTPSGSNSFSLVGSGTYTHSGGNVVATGDINIIYWNGTIWSLTEAINVDLTGYATSEDLNNTKKGILSLDPNYVEDINSYPFNKSDLDFSAGDSQNTLGYYFDRTLVSQYLGDELKSVSVKAELSATVSITFFTRSGNTATILQQVSKAVVAGVNTFDVASLSLSGTVINADEYWIAIKTNTANSIKILQDGLGATGVFGSDLAITDTTATSSLWISKKIATNYKLNAITRIDKQLQSIAYPLSLSPLIISPYSKAALTFTGTGTINGYYGDEETYFEPRKLFKYKIKAGASGTIRLLFMSKIGGVFNPIFNFTKSISGAGVFEITAEEMNLPDFSSYDRVYIFSGNISGGAVVFNSTRATPHNWYSYAPDVITSYTSNVEFSFWIETVSKSIVELVCQLPLSKWNGKKGVTFGDSITWYDGNAFTSGHTQAGQIAIGYQSYLRTALGATIDNQGVSSMAMIEIANIIKAYAGFGTSDFVTITSGANDARRGLPLGAIAAIGATFDLTTFYGSLQSAIEFIITANSLCKIYLMTPINGWFNESGTIDVPGPYNGEMFISRDFVNAIIAVGKLYAIPVYNWYDNSFINKVNRPTYIGDVNGSPYYLHPTQAGFKLMGQGLSSFINSN